MKHSVNFKDLSQKIFGQWTVVSLASNKPSTKWLCQCKCGELRSVAATSLTTGQSTSCGCSRFESDEESKKRLMSFVEKCKNGCWNWTGCKNPNGYGLFCLVRKYLKRKCQGSHRASWILHHGEIPIGMSVLHHCDNPACINPEHLYLGTYIENTRDRVNRNRGSKFGPSGEKHGMSKLTCQKVNNLRKRAESGESLQILASELSITIGHARQIVSGMYWKKQI